MIIGHYDHEIWAKGGVATYIRRISKAQEEAGHKVYFFSRHNSKGDNEYEAPLVVETEKHLFERAKQLNLDILHLHRPVAHTLNCQTPLIRTVHGHSPYCPSGSKFFGRWNKPCNRQYSIHGCLQGYIFDRCGSMRPQNIYEGFQYTHQEKNTLIQIPVITVSHFLKEQMVLAGYPENNIHVLHLFAPELSAYSPPPQINPPRFVFLGRLLPQKGLHWLLRAVQRISTPIHLDVAGEGYQEQELKQLTHQLRLNNQVTFHGWKSQTEIKDLVDSARAVIFPSLWHEPAGWVTFEAMARGRAIIMSRVGGMPEVVADRQNALLVKPNNTKELVESIEILTSDYSLAKKLGESGRKLVLKEFTLEGHMSSLMLLYMKALK